MNKETLQELLALTINKVEYSRLGGLDNYQLMNGYLNLLEIGKSNNIDFLKYDIVKANELFLKDLKEKSLNEYQLSLMNSEFDYSNNVLKFVKLIDKTLGYLNKYKNKEMIGEWFDKENKVSLDDKGLVINSGKIKYKEENSASEFVNNITELINNIIEDKIKEEKDNTSSKFATEIVNKISAKKGGNIQ